MIVRSLNDARPLCTPSAASLTHRRMRLDKCIYTLIPAAKAVAPGRGGLRGKPDDAQFVATRAENSR